jgi:DNA invertase Pin-like site-specific DNA recombinase
MMMSRVLKAKQFPAEELLRMFSDTTSISAIAEAVGADFHTVYKWKHKNIHINQWYADKYAIRLGLHPSAIWNDWFSLEAV